MPRELYQAFPSVTPSGPATDTYQHIDTPVSPLGKSITDFGEKQQQATEAFIGMQNETAAKEADIGFSSAVNKTLSDPDNGYLTKFGKDAAQGYGAVDQQVQDLYQQYRKTLPPQAQKMFDQVAVRRVQNAQEQASNHAASENKKWILGTHEARIQNEVDNSALSWGDDKAFDTSLGTIGEEAKDRASMLGEGPEQEAMDVRHYQSEAIEARITSAMKADPILAQSMLDKYGDKIDAPHLARITATLEPMVQNAQARTGADTILDNAKMQYNGGGYAGGGKAATNAANNNPGNLKVPGSATQFQTFSTPQAGIDAVDHQIGLYIDRGNNTIKGIVSTYAPPSDNNPTPQYIDFVAKKAGIDPNTSVTKADIPKIRDAMIQFEQGTGTPSQAPSAGKQYQTYADYLGSHEPELMAQAEAQAEREQPGNAAYSDQLQARVQQHINVAKSQQIAMQTADKHTVYSAINGTFSNGHLLTSTDEILATPQARDAWIRMQADDSYGALAIETKLMTANSKGAASGYGANFYSMLQSITAPSTDPRYVSDTNKFLPYVTPGDHGPLSNTGFSQLNAIMGLRGTPAGETFVEQTRNFLEAAHNQISGSNQRAGVLDAKGDQQFNKFLQTAVPAILAGNKAGKTGAQMFDPKSPDYIGTSIYNFTRPVAQRVKDMTDDMMVQKMYGPKPLDAGRVAAIDTAIKNKVYTPEQGAALKAIMQQLQDKKITRKQAEQAAVTQGLIAPHAPDVPLPHAP